MHNGRVRAFQFRRTARVLGGRGMQDGQVGDYLDDYDHFAEQRRAHLAHQTEVKRIQDAARRKAKKDAALAWRQQGTEALGVVQSRVQEIKFRLQPYHHYRQTMDLLLDTYYESLALDDRLFIHSTRSTKMLHILRQESCKTKFRIQSNLILWRFSLHRELLDHFRRRNPYQSQFWHLVLPRPLKVARWLLRYFAQFIPVEKEQRDTLYKKRRVHRKAADKLALIHHTQEACAYIPKCKSMQHYHPKGCGHCGVVFIGGTLSGAVPYVKSVGRDTGVPTLVTLEFEIETLAQEEAVQEVVEKAALDDLTTFEDVVFMHVRLGLQRWWGIVLAFKRWSRREKRVVKSFRQQRIRRMVQMKRELDVRIRAPQPLTVEEYYHKYCDIPGALREHVRVINDRKRQRLLNVAQALRKKLGKLVEEGRERRYQEWLRLQSIPPPEKPIVMKTLPNVKLGIKLMCYRPQCNLRKFMTKERFDIHMAVHCREDAEKQKLLDHRAILKEARGREEERFLEVLADYREALGELVKGSEALVLAPPGQTDGEAEDQLLCRTCQPAPWLALPHRYQLTRLYHSQHFYLELVSRAVGIAAPHRVPLLPNALTKIGRAPSNDCVITSEPESNVESVLARVELVHCIIHHEIEDAVSGQSVLYVVDNKTLWGTYSLSSSITAAKVPSRGRAKHSYLQNGTLLCIAAKAKGEAELSAVMASAACVVYRLQSQGM